MTHIEIEQRINAPAAAVWDCYLGSRAEELAIGVYADRITTQGQGQGSVRTSQLLGGAGVIKERIDEFDEHNMLCRYSLIDRGPMPFADYTGTIKVTPDGDNTCILRLEADYTPVGMSEAESINLYRQNNLGGIAAMKTLLGIS